MKTSNQTNPLSIFFSLLVVFCVIAGCVSIFALTYDPKDPVNPAEGAVIDALDGKTMITDSIYVNSDMEKFGLTTAGPATPMVSVKVIELDESLTIREALVNGHGDELVLTQSQIVHLCENYPMLLCKGLQSKTVFLTKNDEGHLLGILIQKNSYDDLLAVPVELDYQLNTSWRLLAGECHIAIPVI